MQCTTIGLEGDRSNGEELGGVEPSSASVAVQEAPEGGFQSSEPAGSEGGLSARPAGSPSSSSLIHEEKLSQPCQQSTYGAFSDEPEAIEVEGEKQGIARFPDRLARYHRGHSRAEEMAEFIQGLVGDRGVMVGPRVLKNRASKLRLCGGHLIFRHYFTEDVIRLHEGMFCQQDKLCPLCALRRGAKLLRKYTEKTLAVLSENKQLTPFLVTHTVKDGADLSERFNHLVKGAKEQHARRRRYFDSGPRRRWPWTEAAVAQGSVESIEVKRGSGSGLWHPHMHAVWLCSREPDELQLQEEWRDITGDSHQVNVQPFHFIRDGLPGTAENVSRDFCEVFKYSLKLAGLSLADNWEAFLTLQGRHFITPRGVLYGVKLPEDLADDPLDDEDLPYVQWFYRYTKAKYVLEHFAE